ncbi:MAG: hypothetical protein RMJ67_08915 [Elusimicrobiota bacterium]|nr:hypothetical protein [Endomicrobiia bacterium]MDW8166617.1 hypothetical protein [Elusimicrobiota bacterium]
MLLTSWAYYEFLLKGARDITDAQAYFLHRIPELIGREPFGYKVHWVIPLQKRITPNYIGLFDLPRWIRPTPHPSYVFRTPLQMRKEEE